MKDFWDVFRKRGGESNRIVRSNRRKAKAARRAKNKMARKSRVANIKKGK